MIAMSFDDFSSCRYTMGTIENDQCVGLCICITKTDWKSFVQWVLEWNGPTHQDIIDIFGVHFFIPQETDLFSDSSVFGIGQSVEVRFLENELVELRFLFLNALGNTDFYEQSVRKMRLALCTLGYVFRYFNYFYEPCGMESDKSKISQSDGVWQSGQFMLAEFGFFPEASMSRYALTIDLSRQFEEFLRKIVSEKSLFYSNLIDFIVRSRNRIWSINSNFLYGFSVSDIDITLQVDDNCACIGGCRRDDESVLSISSHNINTAQQVFLVLLAFARIFEGVLAKSG